MEINSPTSINDNHDVNARADERLIIQGYNRSLFGIAFWDKNDKLLTCNPKFTDFFLPIANHLAPGLSFKKFLSIAVNTSEIYSGKDPEAWVNDLKMVHSEGGHSEIILPDGRCFEIHEQILESLGVVTTVNDISAQLRGERALRKAKELAEEANANKSRFLRAANHDLRQPLATLKILIYSCINEENEEHRKNLLHAMDISASIMEDILGALLQVGQLDAGKIVPRITNFQLAPLLERIQIQFQHQASEKGLSFKLVSSKVTIISDSALLERVISNFVANAIRYTDIGKILIGVRRHEKFVRLEIHDTGCGISHEHIDTIFDEFYQIPKDANQRKEGLGLGLSISQRIANLLGHDIHVQSTVGSGTIFAIDLPIGDVRKSEIGEPEITEAIGGQFAETKVLIIEDDEILRGTLVELFSRWGVDIRQAANEDEVNTILNSEDWVPELLLADYRLRAGALGTQIVGRIRKKLDRHIPSIVMTADTEPEIIEEIKSQKFPVLIKPINPPQLRLMMHNILFEPEMLEEI